MRYFLSTFILLLPFYGIFLLQLRSSGQQLKVRLGEWDASSSIEAIQPQEFIVSRIFVHPQFVAASLRNDIAILRLATAVPLGATPTIGIACLPANQLSGMRCYVAGEQIFTHKKIKV